MKEKEIVKRPKPKHYVNNKELLRLVVENLEARKIDPTTTLHMESIGKSVLAIATNISYCHKLIKYRNYFDSALVDEWIQDSVINCLKYMHNFNPEKSSNPFAYFSQISYNAQLRGIIKENKSLEVRRKLTERVSVDNSGFSLQEHDVGETFVNTGVEYEMSKIDSMG